VAVIVNDMSEVNIDAALVKHGGGLSRTEERLVEMSNGCICCTLREDLLAEVSRLAREGRFDYLLIESTGISEPMPVAQTFTFATSRAQPGRPRAPRHDGHGGGRSVFLEEYASRDPGRARDGAGRDDERTLVELLVDQVEFADVLVISKIDLVPAEDAERLEGILRSAQPGCARRPSGARRVPLRDHGDRALRPRSRGGLGIRAGLAACAASTSRRPRPTASPASSTARGDRFTRALLRPASSRTGRACCAPRASCGSPRDRMTWASGLRPAARAASRGWASGGPTCRGASGPRTPKSAPHLEASWAEPWGDRRQELVLIGVGMDRAALTASLDACLLTEPELAGGPAAWRTLEDPLGAWTEPDEDEAS
jgi:G3E family GTPase